MPRRKLRKFAELLGSSFDHEASCGYVTLLKLGWIDLGLSLIQTLKILRKLIKILLSKRIYDRIKAFFKMMKSCFICSSGSIALSERKVISIPVDDCVIIL